MDDQGNALEHIPDAPLPQISEDTIKQMIAQQGREAELRSKELDLRAMELRNSSAHAEKILGAQERDREAERTHFRKSNRDRYYFLAFCGLLVIALIMWGIYMGKDQFIEDVVKVLVGGVGGYGFAHVKGKRKPSDEDAEGDDE